jgi:hypothetical protein
MWQKRISLILAVVVVVVASLFLALESKECCLCSSFRYHAPCLVDLKTGEMIELRLYEDHPALVAELSEEQSHNGTFSFIRLNGVSGTKLTGPEKVELLVPNETVLFPALCNKCKQQLPSGLASRFVLADLHGMEDKYLIPIVADTALSLRCYDISMEADAEKDGIAVVILGTLGQ